MQEAQSAKSKQIAARPARPDALQARSFVDRLLDRVPVVVV